MGLDLRLEWVPREVNSEADALSNLRFEGFNQELRIETKMCELPFRVLPRLQAEAESFYSDVATRTAVPRKRGHRSTLPKLREREPWQ